MEYRNIDTDFKLFFWVKRYYLGKLSIDQLHWKLESEGYSKREIDLAINDYYLIYIRTNYIQLVCIYLAILFLIAYLIYSLLFYFI